MINIHELLIKAILHTLKRKIRNTIIILFNTNQYNLIYFICYIIALNIEL